MLSLVCARETNFGSVPPSPSVVCEFHEVCPSDSPFNFPSMNKHDINLLLNHEPQHIIFYLMFVVLFPQLDFNFLDDRSCTLIIWKRPPPAVPQAELCVQRSVKLVSHTKGLGRSHAELILGRKESRHDSLLGWRPTCAKEDSELWVFRSPALLRNGSRADFLLENSSSCVWKHPTASLDTSICPNTRWLPLCSAYDKIKTKKTNDFGI